MLTQNICGFSQLHNCSFWFAYNKIELQRIIIIILPSFENIAGVLQRLRGCKINSSGEFPFDKWGVDGKDFLNFDPETLTWTSLSYKANHLATEWNSRYGLNDAYRKFSQTLCNTIHILKQVEAATDDTETGKFHQYVNMQYKGVCVCCFSLPLHGKSVRKREDTVGLIQAVFVQYMEGQP